MILSRQLRCQRSPKPPQSRCPACFALYAPQHSSGTHRGRLTARVANPRHNTDAEAQGDGSWDKESAEPDHHASDTATGLDWAKLQSLAFLAGASTLAAVVTVQLSGTADLQGMAYDNIPKPLQEALPELGEDRNKGPLSQLDVGAAVQKFSDQGKKQTGGLTLPFELPYHNDRQKSPEKVKAERQESFDKSKQDRQAKTEQNKKERQQRQKQKERDKDEAEKREKERKEKERKEKEKRKRFRDQALMGGSLFGVSALTFGKWQLFASLGAVVFRTIGGPTLLSSVLRTPGYIIGRGMRVVEWDVTESPTGPTGHLVSIKLRALTPDGIRIAIAKEYGLSNYREVRQVSHWVTTTTPYFFEPMRTAATFKMLPDPAFVVWSRHPPTGAHKLPTCSSSPQSADTSGQDPLEGLAADQVTAVMLKTISGVAAASRLRPRSGGQMAADSDSSRQRFNDSGSRSAEAASDRLGTAAAMDNASEASEEDVAHSSSARAQERHPPSNGTEASAAQTIRQDFQQTAPGHAQQHAADGNGISSSSAGHDTRHQPRMQAAKASAATLTGYENSDAVLASREEEERQGDSQASPSSNDSESLPHHAADSGLGHGSESEATCRTRHLFHRSSREFAEDVGTLGETRPAGYQSGGKAVLSDSHAFSGHQDAGASQKESDDSQKSPEQKNAQDGQERSGEDEVAGALQGEADSNKQSSEEKSTEAKEPHLWSEPSVLQCLCDSPSVSADTWGERLKLPDEFVCFSDDEEDCMVMAACKPDSKMLSLFRAYAPHNILTFMRFVRLFSLEQ
ncbi:TPA: hypothetical protein ACH3X1_003051 [Trebouxia sp. C0004]